MTHGVYQIRNIANSKVYIGSAAGHGFVNRRSSHFRLLRMGTHHSIALQRAWNKYGEKSLIFEILLYCDPENCLIYEQLAMDHYKPAYDICPTAGSQLGFKHSLESKLKMSKAHQGKIIPSHRGSTHSMSKLDEHQVKQIKHELHMKVPQQDIADRFGVTQSAVSRIGSGERWGWLQ